MAHFKNIYLAEDDTDDVEFFTEALRDICPGCILTVSGNGEELLNTVQHSANKPDIIFTDVNMPGTNGIEALISLKNNSVLKSIPVIIYSTSANPDSVKSAYDNGANHYFTKPSSFSTLTEKLKMILSVNWSGYTMPAAL